VLKATGYETKKAAQGRFSQSKENLGRYNAPFTSIEKAFASSRLTKYFEN